MAGDKDPFDLTGQPAEQRLDAPAVTKPAAETASSAERYAPGTWLESPPDVVEDRPPARTLGRVRMPTRVVLLAVLPLLLVGTYRYLLFVLEAYEHLTWVWWWVLYFVAFRLATIVCWVVVVRWILRRHEVSALVAWRKPTRQDWKWVVGGLAFMVAFWLVYWEIIPWIGWDWALPVPIPDGVDVVAFPYWWNLLLFAVGAVLIAPFVKETFFRGFVLGGLNRVWWLIPSALFSAVLFSAMHFSLHLIIPFSVGGLVFGAMYLRTKHLTAPAMAHAGWNLGVTVLLLIEYGVG